jgi:hypothetical protein
MKRTLAPYFVSLLLIPAFAWAQVVEAPPPPGVPVRGAAVIVEIISGGRGMLSVRNGDGYESWTVDDSLEYLNDVSVSGPTGASQGPWAYEATFYVSSGLIPSEVYRIVVRGSPPSSLALVEIRRTVHNGNPVNEQIYPQPGSSEY